MENLLKEHDGVVNSASLNQVYMESHLVIGYIGEPELGDKKMNVDQ